jgi:hypothetical protein
LRVQDSHGNTSTLLRYLGVLERRMGICHGEQRAPKRLKMSSSNSKEEGRSHIPKYRPSRQGWCPFSRRTAPAHGRPSCFVLPRCPAIAVRSIQTTGKDTYLLHQRL